MKKQLVAKKKRKTKLKKSALNGTQATPFKGTKTKKDVASIDYNGFLFYFTILVILYFISPLSRISKVTVSGTNEVFDQSVIDASQLKKGDSLWEAYFNRAKMEQELKGN